MLIYTNRARNIYALDKIAVDTDWGIPTSFNDTSNILCERHSSNPVTLWIVGEVTKQYWFETSGFPAARASIAVQPLSSVMHNLSTALLNGVCMPRGKSTNAATFGPDQVRAGRWMTVRGKKGQSGPNEEFTDYFDATVTLKDKSAMTKLSVERIREHDIVLLETRVVRYNTEKGADGRVKRGPMNQWQVCFNLESLYLVEPAPGEYCAFHL
ncbi:hypothetical protein K438DRAFT_1558867 [Mycena galopus ATCC 62051]|nr:hypothetical protein K438DRAFT_1558867 [Mycena galopus ATCC 62051]